MPDDPTAWAAPLPSTRGDRLRAIGPALVLAVIALVGVRNHVDHDQSSWEGASFGMFATYENHVWRVVEVTVVGADGEYQAVLPADLRDDAARLRVAPSDGAAERLARAALERVDDPGEVTVRVTLYGIELRDDGGFRLRYEEMRRGEGEPVIARARLALTRMDPLVLLLRCSLITVLVNSNDDLPVMVLVVAATVIALPRPALLRSPWLWAVLFVGIGLRQLTTWHDVDDHIIATTYWCGALALGLTATDPRRTLAASARVLVGTLFAFAAGWKLFSGEFVDGTFFRFELLLDDRFAQVARVVGGTTRATQQTNLDAVEALAATPSAGGEVVLREGARNGWVATTFTAWGIFIETAVAVTFLLPLRRRWELLRHAALVGFAATTYLIVPVGGFGTLLLVLGSAQATSDRLRIAYVGGAAALLVWAGVWPTIFL